MKMSITPGTIARTIILIVALVNQILTVTGHAILPFDDETITETVSIIFTVITSIIAWWKNNSFTQAALMGDEVMRGEKAAKKASKE